MKNVLLTALLAVVFVSTTSAKTLLNVDKSGVGIKGYDPVAYFTDNQPIKGSAQFQSDSNGVTYHFASARSKAVFDANPGKYEPQFGGFCAWAVSQGYTAPIDPNAFQVVNGRAAASIQPECSQTIQPGHGRKFEKGGRKLACHR